jgi:hypothetical protein
MSPLKRRLAAGTIMAFTLSATTSCEPSSPIPDATAHIELLTANQTAWHKLKLGMRTADVRELLGEPTSIELDLQMEGVEYNRRVLGAGDKRAYHVWVYANNGQCGIVVWRSFVPSLPLSRHQLAENAKLAWWIAPR